MGVRKEGGTHVVRSSLRCSKRSDNKTRTVETGLRGESSSLRRRVIDN